MIILGAGLAGLIAGRIWAPSNPVILEKNKEVPQNHSAVLRCRTYELPDTLGMHFEKVKVYKQCVPHDPMGMNFWANRYSLKVTGAVENRSIRHLKPVVRYIPPAGFSSLLARGLHIHTDHEVTLDIIRKGLDTGHQIVSTLPMPVLMKIVKWQTFPDFRHRPIFTINIRIKSPAINVYQTNYYPRGDDPHYRASLNGPNLIIECVRQPENAQDTINSVLADFGIEKCDLVWDNVVRLQPFGKMLPISEEMRQEFIYTMTREYGIYSLGRFATWRPLLLDDLCKDVRVITKLLNMESSRRDYHQALATVQGTA